jgi:hypothetical protein
MAEPDQVMLRLGEALQAGQSGERARAHALFAALWTEIGPDGDAFHRMSVAHSMADVQDDPHDELGWDLLALEAAQHVTQERAAEAGLTTPVAALFPSLHLNLGEDYRTIGDLESARDHLALGQEAAGALPDDGYGTMIRNGLAALADRLSR